MFKSKHSFFSLYESGETDENLITLAVVLSCDSTRIDSVLDVTAASPTSYQYLLTSRYSCLQSPSGNGNKGLSGGSILCIIFSVCVFVYFVGGKQ